MTKTETNERPDQALGPTIRAKSQLGTHLHPDADPQTALFVEGETGALGDNQSALAIRPGTGLVRGTAHTIGTEQTQDIDGGSGDPRRDVVYLDDTGGISVEKGTPAQRSWPDHIDENQQTTTNAVRPAPPDMAAIDGLPLAVIDVGKNAGTLGTGAITDVRAPAPAASVGGVTTVASDLVDAQEALDAGAGDGVRVALDSGVYLNNDSGTIHVRPNTTLELREGAVIEPATRQAIVQLRGGGLGDATAGRITGPGMLRSHPNHMEASTLADFDGAAHVLVDGADDLRGTRDDFRGTNARIVDGVQILGDIAATGGYGIHLKATGGYDYVWTQEFRAYTFGCENAIRMEATGAESASVNGNTFEGRYVKPGRIVNEVLGDAGVNALSHNEVLGMGQASTATDEMYHIEGKGFRRRGTDFDVTRPAVYASFGPDSFDNAILPDSLDEIADTAVVDEGTRNVVRETLDRAFESGVYATVHAADQSLPAATWTTIAYDDSGTNGADAAGEWDNTANQFTAAVDGTVTVEAQVFFKDTTSGDTLYLRIMKNGVELVNWTEVSSGAFTEPIRISRTLSVGRNDTVSIEGYCENGGTVNGVPDQSNISIQKVD